MSYLGQVELKSSEIRRVNVTGSTSATHTLTWTPPSEQSLIITINGIKQQNNYTISGVTLTLDTALIATDAMEVVGILDIGEAVTPPDDSISTVKIQDDAVTAAKLANSINTEITANTAKVTNATHTGDVTGATALTIAADAVDIAMLSATGVADATTFLRGDNAWAAAGSDNTPSWYVKLSGDFSCTTGSYHKVQFDTEVWDTDSAYDSTTNYRFTVPVGEGGKYLVTGGVRWPTSTSKSYYLEFWKNGAAHDFGARRYYSTGPAPVFTNTAILDLAASDYCEMYVVQGSGGTVSLDASNAYFSGFKLAGV